MAEALEDRVLSTPRSRSRLVRISPGFHAAVAMLFVAAPRAWPIALGGILVNHALLTLGTLTPRSALLGPNLRRLPGGSSPGQVVLTFDDGPDPGVTPRVLDLLDAHGARASFFCVGSRAVRSPEIVAEIVRRGHRVENHSYAHSRAFSLLGPTALARELDRSQEILTRLAGSPPRWFRAPAGFRGPWLDAALQARRLGLVSWTRRAFDTVARDPAVIVRRLTRGLAAGDILVLHDRASSRGGKEAAPVLEALPLLLEILRHSELRAVSLPAPCGSASG